MGDLDTRLPFPPFAACSPSQLYLVHEPLLSCIRPPPISWNILPSFPLPSAWTAIAHVAKQRERAARRQGSPGRVCLATSRVACRLRHVRRPNTSSTLSDLHLLVLSCRSLPKTCRRRLAIRKHGIDSLVTRRRPAQGLHLSDKPTKATLVHATAPPAKAPSNPSQDQGRFARRMPSCLS
jgi:hypothetical protein